MRPRPLALALGLLGLALSGLAGCGGRAPLSVLVVTLDATRADALGAYGASPSVTPNLDRLTSEGIVFEHAYTVAPLTLPAHASMLTGLFPPRHGVRDDGIAPLPRSAVTLAERAQAAGFQTAAFPGAAALDSGSGLEQGFETYVAPARRFFGERRATPDERPAAEVATLAAAWLAERDRARPFLLWAHFRDPHAPHEPPAALREKAGGDAYLGEIAACDLALGRLLAALRAHGVEDSTLVVVVADHGEARGEHGETAHGAFVWNTTLRVPLIVRLPDGDRAGERVGGVASVADVCPTALAAMGLEPAEQGGARLDGLDLLARDADDALATRGAYFESYRGFLSLGWHPLAGWVDATGKYVHAPRERFYDVLRDPREERDLAGERALDGHRAPLAELGAAPALERDAEALDPELRRALEAVGYAAVARAGAAFPAPLAALPLPDPHERVQELAELRRAEGLIASGAPAEAERVLRRVLERHPESRGAWDALALALAGQGRHREAIPALERVVSGPGAPASTWSRLGACRLVVGAEEEAIAAFTRALELDGNDVHALGGLLGLMESAGMKERAKPLKQRFEALQLRP